ncbi:DUF1700 domain-containing protein [Roseburia hominis]
MNREEYMKSLSRRLKRLPKEDFEKAMAYYEEYFDDAGPENEQQAIEDLGTPEMAADQLIREFALENAKEPPASVKKGLSAVWVGVLAVFAVPVGVPLALAVVVLLLALVIVVGALIFSVWITAFALMVCSVPCILLSFYQMTVAFADGIGTLGAGLVSLGVGVWVVFGSMALSKWFLNVVTRMFGKLVGGKKREK